MSGKKSLGPEQWCQVFTRLADVLSPDTHRHVTIIGGVAMAMGYGGRRSTDDADAALPPENATEIIAAADSIADEFSLPRGWLNQKAVEAGKIVPPVPDRVVFDRPSLVLEVPGVEHMLAMKVARFAGGTDDVDAKILLRRLRLRYGNVEDVWSVIGGLVLLADRDRARHNLLALWEDLNESA